VQRLGEIGQYQEFWNYIVGGFSTALCEPQWYNGINHTRNDLGLVAEQLRPIGYISFRQVRLRPDSCKVPSAMVDVEDQCYGEYSQADEDREPFGPVDDPQRYKWSSGHAKEWGSVALSYGDGGYESRAYLANSEDGSADGCQAYYSLIDQLQKDTWLDRATAMVRISAVFGNANMNIMASFRVMIEVSPAGGLYSVSSSRTFRIDLWHDRDDIVRTVFEVIFVLFVGFYAAKFALRWAAHARETGTGAWGYLNDSGWNVFELISLLSYLGVIGLRLAIIASPARINFSAGGDVNHTSLENLGILGSADNSLTGFCCLMGILMLFKYMRLSDRMSLLWIVLAHASKDLVPFTIMFFTIFLAYATMGHLVFGPTVPGWATFTASCLTLFRMLIGDISYQDMSEANKIIAPLFLTSFVVLLFFILVNVFLAICTDAYSEVQAVIKKKEKSLAEKGFGQRILKNASKAVRLSLSALTCGLLGKKKHHSSSSSSNDVSKYTPDQVSEAALQHQEIDEDHLEDHVGGQDSGFLALLSWVTSAESRLDRIVYVIGKTLTRLLLEGCTEANCLLPIRGMPIFRNNPDTGETHLCRPDREIPLSELQAEVAKDVPKVADRPTAADYEYVILKAAFHYDKNWKGDDGFITSKDLERERAKELAGQATARSQAEETQSLMAAKILALSQENERLGSKVDVILKLLLEEKKSRQQTTRGGGVEEYDEPAPPPTLKDKAKK
jgi:hypothetical protein